MATDKRTVEMEAVASGRLVDIITEAGAGIPVRAVMTYPDDEA